MKTASVFAAVLGLFVVVQATAADHIVIGGSDGLDPSDTAQSFPVMLALSGGGARGLTAIGILKAFEERGIQVAGIAGTSIGGIIGGLYAAGYSPDELTSIVRKLDFSRLLSNTPARTTMFLTQREERERHLLSVRFDGVRPVIPQGLTAGQRLTSLLSTLTAKADYHCGGDFNRLRIPFKTISTDIVTGREVVHDRGSLAEAMRATMGFPLAFTGLERNGQLLMDGGMVTPIPVEIVRRMSDTVEFVVAVNTASPLLPRADLTTPVDIANQVTSIMTADKLAAQLKAADLAIQPPIDEFRSTDFRYVDTLVQIGYACGLAAADSITGLLRRQRDHRQYEIREIRVNGEVSGLREALDENMLGKTFGRANLVAALKIVAYDIGLYRLEAELTPVDSAVASVPDIDLSVTADAALRIADLQLTFVGNSVFGDSTLSAHFGVGEALLTPSRLRQGLQSIIHLYVSAGYDLANVRKVVVSPEPKRLTVEIDEGVVRRIDVEDNRRTRDWFIRSLLPQKVGEPYSGVRASRGTANIYATDLFDRVAINLVPGQDGAIVKIHVEEKQYRQARLGWHWHDEYKSEEFLEVLDDNIGGIGLQFLAHGRYARDCRQVFAEFKADRIFRTYLTSRVQAYHRRLERHLFDADGLRVGERAEIKTGLTLRLGQQLSRFGAVAAGLVVEQIEYEHPDIAEREKLGLRSILLESLVETFDRIPFPTSGKKHQFELQLAGEFLGGEVEFTRFFSSLEAYFALGGDLNYHPKLAIGLSRSDLPFSEKFYVGGAHSFSGFRTHQLSGDKLFLLTNELRLRLPWRFYFIGRYDVGEVYTAADQIKLRNLRHGVGATLALDSPIGPVEFGYGRSGRDQERWYLNVGHPF